MSSACRVSSKQQEKSLTTRLFDTVVGAHSPVKRRLFRLSRARNSLLWSSGDVSLQSIDLAPQAVVFLLLALRRIDSLTFRAYTVNEKVMTRYTEAPRKLRLDLDRAPLHLEHLAAPITVEVMVMFLPSNFVTSGLARNRDRSQPPVFHQRADVSIHGGDADPLDLLLSVRKCLFW